MRSAFDDFVLDTERRLLERRGEPVHLPPKAYCLLDALLERRPKALSKAELHALIWPHLYVSESSLTNLVVQLRRALGDDAHLPRLLRTIHGFGYAFAGEVMELEDEEPAGVGLTCRLRCGEREFVLKPGDSVVGRGSEAEVWVHDERVSRHHARIRLANAKAVLEDLGSRNGTFLNGARLEGPASLADGDEIGIGAATLIVKLAGEGTTLTSLGSKSRARARARLPHRSVRHL